MDHNKVMLVQEKNKEKFLCGLLSDLRKKLTRSKPVVAVLSLHGVIAAGVRGRSGLCLDDLEEHIEAAFKLPKLSAVVLAINSPGGSPVQSELIYNRIRALAEEKQVKVYSFAEDVAASGGYWLACAGDEIYALNSTIVGSIGVISAGFGFHEVIKRYGIERRIYTQGENKAILDPFSPEKESDVNILKSVQQDVHQAFKDLVLNRRKSNLQGDQDELFSGEFWSGKKALSLGLIDGIGDMNTVLRAKYGKDIQIKRIGKKKSWLQRKFGIEKMTNSLIDIAFNKMKEYDHWTKFGL